MYIGNKVVTTILEADQMQEVILYFVISRDSNGGFGIFTSGGDENQGRVKIPEGIFFPWVQAARGPLHCQKSDVDVIC